MADKKEALVLMPTDVAQWHALVNEAQIASSVYLNEELESYLVFLLMRFINEPDILSQPLAMDMLTSFHQNGRVREENLKNVGDRCLLISGLFPGQAEKRMVGTHYFIEMGRVAYGMLANISDHSTAQVYGALSMEFDALADVMYSMRGLTSQPDNIKQVLNHWVMPERPGHDYDAEAVFEDDDLSNDVSMVLFDIPPKTH